MAPLFALDIGTRSVVGIILEQTDSGFHVIDLEVIEHKERSMIDGQIHNIVSVASVISDMKTLLEERHGPLKKVSVAAAGRALKTAVGTMEVDITGQALIGSEDINRLELGAVQKAQQELMSAESFTADSQYYCVGYSVLHYLLDGEPIGSLIDQSGHSASADVIATFLPRVVVESLLSALKRADLEMEALTLEPIAAINVLIPPSMRRLNVAMVDIGAGTSDIAITSRDTVTAFGMVPVAGDEITEALSTAYLLDFPEAETVKRQLAENETVTIRDILGFEQEYPSSQVTAGLSAAIERLAASIATEIRRLNNGESPQAVMLTGGGSLTPGLSSRLSTQLDLPAQRVAVRGLDALSTVTLAEKIAKSPAFVTPIGIAIAAQRAPIHYMSVTVDDKLIRLFELKEMTVGDALLAAGIKARHLYGKPGLALRFTLNGQEITLPGSHGTPSVIEKNGKVSGTKERIENGDTIRLTLGKDGQPAAATIGDVAEMDMAPLTISVNGESFTLHTAVTVNGEPASMTDLVKDHDEIIVRRPVSIRDALESAEGLSATQSVQAITLNGKRVHVKTKSPVFRKNGLPANLTTPVEDGDRIDIETCTPQTVLDIAEELGVRLTERMSVTFNGQEVTIAKPRFSVLVNGRTEDLQTTVGEEDQLTISPLAGQPISFSDVFAFVDYQLPAGTATGYRLLRNGQPIQFHDELFGGDRLEIILT
ncbi:MULTISPECIES: cell division protein FtsA [Sporosarcina]|uniref:cell division protein FtsA n=1 Tax=Sporosarcina TaxID=1569 RepID=UPI00058D7F7B|nr:MULTISPECIES: cell division protein FtsA [Sporosarcina]WJY27943.1 cell division protein FtsA [Sporosarcina sp. 0.2-SM1T-5]